MTTLIKTSSTALGCSGTSLSDQRAGLRYDEGHRRGQREARRSPEEFDDALGEPYTNPELADAQQELEDARQKLDEGWAEVHGDGKVALVRETADARQQIADAEQKLPDALRSWRTARPTTRRRSRASDGKAQYWDGLTDWQDGRKEYEDGYRKLLDGEAEYGENVDKLQSAQQSMTTAGPTWTVWTSFRTARRRWTTPPAAETPRRSWTPVPAALAEGQAQLEEGKRQLKMALAAYDTALSALTGLLQAIRPWMRTAPTRRCRRPHRLSGRKPDRENADEYGAAPGLEGRPGRAGWA